MQTLALGLDRALSGCGWWQAAEQRQRRAERRALRIESGRATVRGERPHRLSMMAGKRLKKR